MKIFYTRYLAIGISWYKEQLRQITKIKFDVPSNLF